MQLPNHTQVPNAIIDEWLRDLPGPAVKCILAICRKTIGWHKISDRISYTQLQDLTGLSLGSISSGLKKLENVNLITIERRQGKTNLVDLNFLTPLRNREDPSTDRRGTPLPNRDTKQSKETLRKKDVSSKGYTQVFEEVWQSYPRKVNKSGAWKAFRTRCREGESAAFLAACAAEYAKQIRGTEERFIMHGATFFGPNKRYMDYKPAKPKAERVTSARRRPKPAFKSLKVEDNYTPDEIKANQAAIEEMKSKLSNRRKMA